MAVLTVLTKHLVLPNLVNGDNVGWWERAYAIVLVGWGGVAAWLIEQRLVTPGGRFGGLDRKRNPGPPRRLSDRAKPLPVLRALSGGRRRKNAPRDCRSPECTKPLARGRCSIT